MENNKEISELVKIKGVLLRLEDVENVHLRRVLSRRINAQKFSFSSGGYKEDKTRSEQERVHTDEVSPEHRDNYRDGHTDTTGYKDWVGPEVSAHTDYTEYSGYSERYNAHTDGWSD